jgi:AraC-like DNA-binding protein
MTATLTPANGMKKPLLLKKSTLQDKGLKLYSYWKLSDGFITAPADTAVHIAFVIEGYGYYGKLKVKAGDVLAFGLNIQPNHLKAHNIAMFIIDLDFTLFYSITGLRPVICRDSVLLDSKNPFYRLGQILFPHPVKHWIPNIEAFISRTLDKQNYRLNNTMIRVSYATNEIDKERDFAAIAEDLNISYRQLQRDFLSVLGLSLKEYQSIRRFYRAAHRLKKESLLKVAQNSGYCNQSHMNKEFKSKSGWTPKEVSKHCYY